MQIPDSSQVAVPPDLTTALDAARRRWSPELRDAWRLVSSSLLARHSATGDVAGLFLHPTQTWITQLPRLVGDPQTEPALRSAESIQRAAVFQLLAAEVIRDGARDHTSPAGSFDRFMLAVALAEEALTALAGSASNLGEEIRRRDQVWSEWGARALVPGRGDTTTTVAQIATSTPEVVPGALSVCLALLRRGATGDETDAGLELGTRLAIGLALRRDLGRLKEDVSRGDDRNALIRAARLRGIEPATTDPAAVLGALVDTGIASEAIQVATDSIRAAASAAVGVGVPAVAALAGEAEDHLEALGGILERVSALAPPGNRHDESRGSSQEQPITMAAGYLRSEGLHGASEIHRHGLLGAREVGARFPMWWVTEILVRRGLLGGDRARQALADIVASGFTYFDHPEFSVADTDSIALACRLARVAGASGADVAAVRSAVARSLDVAKGLGRVPVFLPAETPMSIGLIGEGCGAVAAVFLASTRSFVTDAHSATYGELVADVMGRFVEDGCGISVNYVESFALNAVARLVDGTASGSVDAGLSVAARRRVREELEERARRASNPLDHALLLDTAMLAGSSLDAERLAVSLSFQQRYDGSWSPCPLYWTIAGGGRTSWYESRTMTSALAYDALSGWADSQRDDTSYAGPPALCQ